MHINSGIANQAFYLAIEGGTNRTSGLSVQGVGGGQPRADRKSVLPHVHAAAAVECDVRRGARGHDSGGAGSLRRQQRRRARRDPGLDRGGGQLMPRAVRQTGRAWGRLVLALVAAACRRRATAGSGQTREAGPSVSVNGGGQSAGPGLSDRFEFATRPHRERDGRRAVSGQAGRVIDGGLGIRVWKNLGVGVAVSHATGDGTAEVDAQIPHPLQFNQPRAVSGEQEAIDPHGDGRARAACSTRSRCAAGSRWCCRADLRG